MQQAEAQCQATGRKQRLFAHAAYRAGTWDRARSLIIKAEHNDPGPHPRFLVSNSRRQSAGRLYRVASFGNLPGEPDVLYDGRYCQRGQMENDINSSSWPCLRIAPAVTISCTTNCGCC